MATIMYGLDGVKDIGYVLKREVYGAEGSPKFCMLVVQEGNDGPNRKFEFRPVIPGFDHPSDLGSHIKGNYGRISKTFQHRIIDRESGSRILDRFSGLQEEGVGVKVYGLKDDYQRISLTGKDLRLLMREIDYWVLETTMDMPGGLKVTQETGLPTGTITESNPTLVQYELRARYTRLSDSEVNEVLVALKGQ